jgi:hypothetical protein
MPGSPTPTAATSFQEAWREKDPVEKVLFLFTAPLALLMIFLVCAAMYGLVHDAWDEPVAEDQIQDRPEFHLHPPPDVMAAGRIKMAEEMREWAED